MNKNAIPNETTHLCKFSIFVIENPFSIQHDAKVTPFLNCRHECFIRLLIYYMYIMAFSSLSL